MKQQLLVAPVFSLANDGFGGLSATGPQLQKRASLEGLRKTGAATFVVEKKDCTQPRMSGYLSFPNRKDKNGRVSTPRRHAHPLF